MQLKEEDSRPSSRGRVKRRNRGSTDTRSDRSIIHESIINKIPPFYIPQQVKRIGETPPLRSSSFSSKKKEEKRKNCLFPSDPDLRKRRPLQLSKTQSLGSCLRWSRGSNPKGLRLESCSQTPVRPSTGVLRVSSVSPLHSGPYLPSITSHTTGLPMTVPVEPEVG